MSNFVLIVAFVIIVMISWGPSQYSIDLLLIPFVFGFVRLKDRFQPGVVDDSDKDFSRIRCPSCKWRPTRSDTWACSPGCGEVWNTFETRGECPGCQKRWPATQCIKCGVWSDHDAWYEEPPQKT